MKNSWFAVDKDGLRKLLEERGKAFALFELIQNAWDTDADHIDVTLEKIEGAPRVRLEVVDNDPRGFHDLSHAYTLFAESEKKSDPTKRGRFNLGEKLVLALCTEASVMTTSGSVFFDSDGTMRRGRGKTEVGSVITASLRMTRLEYDEVCAAVQDLIAPNGKTTLFNGEEVGRRFQHLCDFAAKLPTVASNADGVLTRTKRITRVDVYETDGGPGWIYEAGIPVVETGDKYHVDVQQKIPLSMDRDNVPPSYLALLRAEVLNRTSSLLSDEDAQASWVTNALESPQIREDSVRVVMKRRFGDKRATYDMSDPEANMNLTSQGYTIIRGGALPKAAWENVRKAGAALPAGQIAPTPKPYSDDPDAPPVECIPESEWTEGMCEVAEIAQWFAREMDITPAPLVRFVLVPEGEWSAAWTDAVPVLDWNVSKLGRRWFAEWHRHPRALLGLLMHEFAHHWSHNHLHEDFYKGCTHYGSRMAVLMLERERIPHFHKIRIEEIR